MGVRFLSRSTFWFDLDGLRPWLCPYIDTTLNFQAVSGMSGLLCPSHFQGVPLLLLWCLVFFTRLYAYCGLVALPLWSVLVLTFGFASPARLLHPLAMTFCWIYPASGCGFPMVPRVLPAGILPMSGWFCLDPRQPYCRHIQCVLTLGLLLCLFKTFIYSIAYISVYLSSLFWIWNKFKLVAVHFLYFPASISIRCLVPPSLVPCRWYVAYTHSIWT